MLSEISQAAYMERVSDVNLSAHWCPTAVQQINSNLTDFWMLSFQQVLQRPWRFLNFCWPFSPWLACGPVGLQGSSCGFLTSPYYSSTLPLHCGITRMFPCLHRKFLQFELWLGQQSSTQILCYNWVSVQSSDPGTSDFSGSPGLATPKFTEFWKKKSPLTKSQIHSHIPNLLAKGITDFFLPIPSFCLWRGVEESAFVVVLVCKLLTKLNNSPPNWPTKYLACLLMTSLRWHKTKAIISSLESLDCYFWTIIWFWVFILIWRQLRIFCDSVEHLEELILLLHVFK